MGEAPGQRCNAWDGGRPAAKLGLWTAAVGEEIVGRRYLSLL